MLLWAMTLVPALWILGWSLKHARTPKPTAESVGLTADEARRLKRILTEPRDDLPSTLSDDAVRVVSPEEPTPQKSRATRIESSSLAAVTDNTFGVRSSEKPAYDALLERVRSVPLAKLESAARTHVPFAVLMLNADRFRGELLTIDGDVRRLNRLTSSDSSSGETWEAWLFTKESGINPYRVVLASIPAQVATGDELKPPLRVRVTGYFFKRYSYATAGNFHTAPLMIAKTLRPIGAAK